MEKIKTAVVGAGYLGQYHAEKYTQLSQSNLIGICDTNPEIAQRLAEIHEVKAFTNYHELIGQVDAVSIAAPTHLHHEMALFFLERGVHVLVEKPICVTLKEAEELITVANQQKLVLQVGHIERFNPGFKSLQAHTKEALSVESTRLAPFKRRASTANVILDLMIHDLDLIQTIIPEPIHQIRATGLSLITQDIDLATVQLEFADGRLAFLKTDRSNPNTRRELSVYQKDEHLHLDMHAKKLIRYRRPSSNSETEPFSEQLFIPNEDALYNELNAFLNAVLGLEPISVSGEDGFNALKSALSISALIYSSKYNK